MNLTGTAIMMTAWRRPQYLRRTLATWALVDGVQDVAAFVVCLDPSDRQDAMLDVIREAQDNGLPVTAHINPRQYGVSVNPVESGSMIFQQYPDVDYLVMAEEDLTPADDTLRLLAWGRDTFRDDPSVLINCAHSPDDPDPDADPAAVVLLPRFRCWIWGTWRDRWFDVLEPTWDRAYYTGNQETGQQSGFDWHLDLRVIHGHDLHTMGRKFVCSLPLASRSQNIGQYEGVHAAPSAFEATRNPSFREKFGEVEYRIVGVPASTER